MDSIRRQALEKQRRKMTKGFFTFRNFDMKWWIKHAKIRKLK